MEPTKERIDLEQLKVKEKIYFYEDIILYEDELADNGVAKLSVKMASIDPKFKSDFKSYFFLSLEYFILASRR